jgi:hypothetical protein
MQQAAEELRAQAEPKRAYRSAFQHAWNEWTWERNGKKDDQQDGQVRQHLLLLLRHRLANDP